jgi:hypothetical protein
MGGGQFRPPAGFETRRGAFVASEKSPYPTVMPTTRGSCSRSSPGGVATSRFRQSTCPAESRDRFQEFMDSTFRLTKDTDDRATLELIGIAPGDVLDLCKNGYAIEEYRLFHNVPTVDAFP